VSDPAVPWGKREPIMRGVNLGGWLLLERWMQPSLFAGTGARDEFELCRSWGREAERRLREHRESYIGRDDLVWLKRVGINTVRIPFGYWLLTGDPPFVAGIDVLDQALRWCQELGLMAILDFHGLPGAQSREHHTGRQNHFQWHRDPEHQQRSLEILEAIAARYTDVSSLIGIEVVNEPAESIPATLLDRYYRAAYERIRLHLPPERAAVIFPAFTERRLRHFHGRYRPPEFENTITDLHYYQCFGGRPGAMAWEEQISYPLTHRLQEIRRANTRGWLMIGEWSLRLPWKPRDWARELPPDGYDIVMRGYAAAQLWAYEQTHGWCFWTYRAEGEPEWSFRACIERGWLPTPVDLGMR
jgi:glucan 1,3-beta-glucosidase